LLQTHSAEAAAFVWQELNVSLIALSALLVLLSAVLSLLASATHARQRLVRVGSAVMLVAAPFAGKDFVDKGRVVTEAYRQLETDMRQADSPQLRFTQLGHGEAIDVVLIVGESTSRRLMQLYGAPLPTTPELSALGSSLVVLKDVVSAHSHTVPSLLEMMYREAAETGAIDQTFGPTKVSLVDVLHQAGVRVEWISAQAAYGKWADPISRLATRADRVLFTNPDGDGAMRAGKGTQSPDARATVNVLETLAAEPAESRLIVQHMVASH
jgi:glucan phosphoethanolaminetransferase (alkaline phosphatase superfamily)